MEYTNFGILRLGNIVGAHPDTIPYEFELLTKGDLNNDGNDDLVLMAMPSVPMDQLPSSDFAKIAILFYDPIDSTFKPSVVIQENVIYSNNPRRAAIGDFNGDGLNDLFIADTGIDNGSHVGYQNILYTQTDGLLKAVDYLPNTITDFSHGLVAADFNLDGMIDFLVLNTRIQTNDPGRTGTSYVVTNKNGDATAALISIENGGFADFTLNVPSLDEMSEAEKGVYGEYGTGLSRDVNGDRIPDLFLIRFNGDGGVGSIDIFESISIGKYNFIGSTPPANDYIAMVKDAIEFDPRFSHFFPCDLQFGDFDGDMEDEILLNWVYQINGGMWAGFYLQVIDRRPDGAWIDITNNIIPAQYGDPFTGRPRNAHSRIESVDLNGDGAFDVLINSKSGANPYSNGSAAYWLNMDGKLVNWGGPVSVNNNDLSGWPTLVSLDGKAYVVTLGIKWDAASHSALPQSEYLSIQGWPTGGAFTRGKPSGQNNVASHTNDRLYATASDDLCDALGGVDTFVYVGNRADYELQVSSDRVLVSSVVVHPTPFSPLTANDGNDTLINLERIAFSDINVALDVSASGNAGQARLFTGTVAHALIDRPDIVGMVLHFFDQGMSMQQVCQLAIDANLISALAGSSSNEDLAKLVWRNVVGTEADSSAVDLLLSFMDGRNASFSQSELLATAAQLGVNQEHVGLTGLASTGMEYLPFAG